MGRYLSTHGGYGIFIYGEIPNEEMMSVCDLEEEDFFDFCERIISEENKNESNPCKLSYSIDAVDNYQFGLCILQDNSTLGNYDPYVDFDPDKLVKIHRHDEFLFRVAKRFGIKDVKPGWVVVSSYG